MGTIRTSSNTRFLNNGGVIESAGDAAAEITNLRTDRETVAEKHAACDNGYPRFSLEFMAG
jgi:hypothetical protein